MARPRELVPGNCYFTVTYHDADLLVPCVQTLVYSGGGRMAVLKSAFFTHPRRGDEDERLIRLFAGAGVSAHVDYLADRGRTRVLEFAPPFASLDDVVGLCERILTEIHAMRADDCLTFHMIGADSSSKET